MGRRSLLLLLGVVVASVATAGPARSGPSRVERSSDDVIVSQGTVTLRGGSAFDLDRRDGSGADILWDANMRLFPQNGARIASLGVVDFNGVTAVQLAERSYSSDPLQSELVPNDVVGGRTDDRNYFKLKVLKIGDGVITFAWVTYQPPPRLTVTKAGSGSGTVTSSPAGISCGGTCSSPFTNGSSVTLTAAADAGSSFAGWSGACTGTGACTLTLTADASVTATFVPTPTQTLTVTKSGSGAGTVSSSPSGIACGATCTASFARGTSVALTATPAVGSTFAGWSGACSGTGACMVPLNVDATLGARFELVNQAPRISDPSQPEPPADVPLGTANPGDTSTVAAVAAGVTGNGVVTATGGGARATASAAAAPISCGFNRFRCYTRVAPGSRVVLQARPLANYVFQAWTGACAGQSARCVVVARALRTVTAIFAPRVAAATVGLQVKPVSIRVVWNQSVGSGRLVLSGRVGGKAALRAQLRRPGGGALLTRRFAVGAGAFRRQIPLRKSVLPRNAVVLPGGFVLSVTGSSSGASLPFALRPIVVPAPAEGVVRQAFSSATETGPPTPLVPAGATEAWVHFRFATQPSTRLPLSLTWYYPDGKVLGTIPKSNRPEVVGFVRAVSGKLPSGSWVAELRAGSRIVKRAAVRIG